MESSALVFLIPAASLIAAAIVVKSIIDNWTKMRLKDKYSLENESGNRTESSGHHVEMKRLLVNLKYALILIGVGFPPALRYFYDTLPTEVVLGLMLVFAGLGLFIYFLLAKSLLDKTLQKKNKDD